MTEEELQDKMKEAAKLIHNTLLVGSKHRIGFVVMAIDIDDPAGLSKLLSNMPMAAVADMMRKQLKGWEDQIVQQGLEKSTTFN